MDVTQERKPLDPAYWILFGLLMAHCGPLLALLPDSMVVLPRTLVAFVPFVVVGMVILLMPTVFQGQFPSLAVRLATFVVMVSLLGFSGLAIWHTRLV
jgi:hypothetical protein